MAITAADVVLGGEYRTKTNQLRKVTDIAHDDRGRKRVHYVCKSGNQPTAQYHPCHTKSNPPLMDTFVKAVEERVR